MFTRYWRTYPWFLQLFLFAMMLLTVSSLGSYLIWAFLPRLTGVAVKDVLQLGPGSTPAAARAAVVMQGIFHFATFTVPCVLFAYLTHPRPAQYLGLRAPRRPLHWLLAPGVMIGFLFFALYAQSWLVQHVPLHGWLKEMQQRNTEQSAGLLGLKAPADLVKAAIVMALLPAIGEELLFRGILMRFAHKRSRRMAFPVLISALLFMLVHSNPLGAVMIFAAGIVLALIYWLTGSLLCSMLAHFVYNGIQVFAVFAATGADIEVLPWYLPVIGLALFAGCGYALIRTQRPLPPDWSDDFAGDPPQAPVSSSTTFFS